MVDMCKTPFSKPGEISVSYSSQDHFVMPVEVYFLNFLGIPPIKTSHKLHFQIGGNKRTCTVNASVAKLERYCLNTEDIKTEKDMRPEALVRAEAVTK